MNMTSELQSLATSTCYTSACMCLHEVVTVQVPLGQSGETTDHQTRDHTENEYHLLYKQYYQFLGLYLSGKMYDINPFNHHRHLLLCL